MSNARTTGLAGGVVTVLAAGGLVGAGYYFDYTGGGPSEALQWLLWGGLLVGLLVLVVAFVQAARADRR